MQMKLLSLFIIAVLQGVSAHYIFNTLITEETTSKNAICQPIDNSPVGDILSSGMICNVDTSPATETVSVKAGEDITFEANVPIYHKGPAAIYLGRSPLKDVSEWDGTGPHWFKVAEWGAVFDPFHFTSLGLQRLTAKIPKSVPSGQYLIRVEQIGLHIIPAESFISCAQIEITNGGDGVPEMVEIPGYIQPEDPSVTINIYWPIPTSYTSPGPEIFLDDISTRP